MKQYACAIAEKIEGNPPVLKYTCLKMAYFSCEHLIFVKVFILMCLHHSAQFRTDDFSCLKQRKEAVRICSIGSKVSRFKEKSVSFGILLIFEENWKKLENQEVIFWGSEQ